METLKACPFCGAPARAKQINNGPLWVIACGNNKCRLCSDESVTPEQWNTRAPDPLLERMAEALRAVLDSECIVYADGCCAEWCSACKAAKETKEAGRAVLKEYEARKKEEK